MNLKLITTNTNGFEVYNQGELIINVKTDQNAKAFRITCAERKRVFFIEEGDAKSNMDVIINEYSQPLGFLHKLRDRINSGIIETEGVKFIYSVSIKSSVEIMIYKNYDQNPEIFCTIEKATGMNIDSLQMKYILFSLTWFLFLTAEKKEALVFAEA